MKYLSGPREMTRVQRTSLIQKAPEERLMTTIGAIVTRRLLL